MRTPRWPKDWSIVWQTPVSWNRQPGTLHAASAQKPQDVVALGKRLFYEQLDHKLESAYTLASDRMVCNLSFPAAIEGIEAFIEKRSPSWSTAKN